MPSKTTGPEGQMRLYEQWCESANSHVETTETGYLSTENGSVILTITSVTEKFMPRAINGSWEKKYAIDGKLLAELIKNHGISR